MLVKRKWGWYWTILSGERFKVKLLYFRKGKQISLQKHFDRHEHWLFLFGNGAMQITNKIFAIGKGEAAFVMREQWHQYTAYKKTLVLEIQVGERCSEDDIERAGA